MHMLTEPACVLDGQSLVFDQVPKRNCGPLDGKINKPVEGWGLHFQEGLDGRILSGMVLIFVLASLVFAILWSYLKHDVQGAFGVGAYMVTVITVFAALAWNRNGRLG